ncbi:MAG: PTS system mannose/fructose/sorbose family transporter subunit IID [Thermodesulfobacteriota bacterium]
MKVFANSFFIQTSWNYGDIHGLGFSNVVAPALAVIYRDEGERYEALKRHSEAFNIHPYMSAPVIGAVIKMEEEVKEGKRKLQDIITFKKSLSGPYSAIGDMFFWGSARPLASIIGVGATLYFGTAAPLILLLVFNLFHLWMRWFGLVNGYRLGVDVVEYIKELELLKWGKRIRYVTAVLLAFVMTGYLLPIIHHGVPEQHRVSFEPSIYISMLLFTLSVLFLSSLLRRGVSIPSLVYLISVPMTFVVLIGSVWLF